MATTAVRWLPSLLAISAGSLTVIAPRRCTGPAFCLGADGRAAQLDVRFRLRAAAFLHSLGQKRTSRLQFVMSALPPKADIDPVDGMSALGHKRT